MVLFFGWQSQRVFAIKCDKLMRFRRKMGTIRSNTEQAHLRRRADATKPVFFFVTRAAGLGVSMPVFLWLSDICSKRHLSERHLRNVGLYPDLT